MNQEPKNNVVGEGRHNAVLFYGGGVVAVILAVGLVAVALVLAMGNAGAPPQPTTPTPTLTKTPTATPTGKIAFGSGRYGNREIYVMGADGSGQTRLTNNTADDWWPSWGP
ncbi:MAG: hypothetical protein HY680_02950 [Chloroflexi bacterium]|nr:hypothetical protein [Chloroflexota bacterium]